MKFGNTYENLESEYQLNIFLTNDIDNSIKGMKLRSLSTISHNDTRVNFTPLQQKKYNEYIDNKNLNNNTFSTDISIDKQYIKSILHTDILNTVKKFKLQSIFGRLSIDSKFTIVYEIKASGRMYSNISNLSKDIRYHLLKDYTEYDISAASASYFYQVAKQLEPNINLPYMSQMLDDKTKFRELLAGFLALSPYDSLSSDDKTKFMSIAKGILTMLGFNAKTSQSIECFDDELNEWIIPHPTSIEELLIKNKIDMVRFYNEPILNSFFEELTLMMDICNQYLKEKHINKKLKVNGKILKLQSYSKSKALAFFYQSWESDFLLSMRDTYVNTNSNKDYFLLHDAIYVKKEIDIKLLENSKQSGDFIVDVVLGKT